jgi:hypothetical protein
MKTFKHFPEQAKCPICGKNDDKECVLVLVHGTQQNEIAEAKPIHLDCIELWLYKPDYVYGKNTSMLVQQFEEKA